ncbi:MAG: TolC family protein [Bacteroidetes bacterium]|nr:TolC family protein [Bacteroidota bacterium]
MFRISILTLLLLLITAAGLRAQTLWTLQECIDYAVIHSAQMEVQQANNRIQDLNLRDAKFRLAPDLSGYASGGYNFGRTLDPETNTYTNIQYLGSNLDVSGSMPLFAGLSNLNNVRFERYGQLKGRKDSQKLADDTAMEVLQLYYEALYRIDLAAQAKEQAELSEKEVVRMRRQVELGLKAKADIAEAEAKEAADLYYLINCENNCEIARLNLKRKMNFPVDELIEIEAAPEELRQMVGATVRADSLYLVALERLPHSESSALAVKQAKARVAMQKGLLFPSLSLGGDINSRYYNTAVNEQGFIIPFKTQISNNASEYIGLTLRVPLFSGLSRNANVQRAKQNLRIAEANHNDLLQEVYKEVQRAVQDLNASVKAYDQAVKQERARALAFDVNQKKYEEGIISILDLYTSANLLLAAKVETIGNLMKMNAQRRIVAYYEGTPLTTVDLLN